MTVYLINRFFYPDESPTSQLLSDLAFFLAANDYDVHVITTRLQYTTAAGRLPSEECIDSVKIHRLWTSSWGRGNLLGRLLDYCTFFVVARRYLAKHLEAGNIVIAKTDPPLLAAIIYSIVERRQAQLINWMQDLFPEIAIKAGIISQGGFLQRLCRSMRARSLCFAAHNVVVGKGMKECLTKQLDPTIAVSVISNWSDGELIKPIAAGENSLREAWQLNDAFVIGYSGNMGHAHEFETILHCAEAMRGDGRFRFLFIGNGVKRNWIQRQVVERGLKNVIFKEHQPRDKFVHSLAALDVHVVSLDSGMESYCLPSKFYTALAAGRPILFIGSLNSELAEILEENRCGFAIDIGDSASLVNHIRNLEADNSNYALMGAAARKTFELHFSKTKGLNAWQQVFTSLEA